MIPSSDAAHSTWSHNITIILAMIIQIDIYTLGYSLFCSMPAAINSVTCLFTVPQYKVILVVLLLNERLNYNLHKMHTDA